MKLGEDKMEILTIVPATLIEEFVLGKSDINSVRWQSTTVSHLQQLEEEGESHRQVENKNEQVDAREGPEAFFFFYFFSFFSFSTFSMPLQER